MGDISITMTGDEARLWKSFQRIIGEQTKMEGGLEKISRKSQQVEKDISKAFAPTLLKGFLGGLAGAGGVLAALRLIHAEIENIRSVQSLAAQQQITAGSARKDVIRNLAGRSPAEIQAVLKSLGGISAKTGVGEAFISQAMAQALSAGGGDIGAATAAVEQAARFLSDKPGGLGEFAGSLLDLSKVTGTTSAKVNQGLLTLVGSMSRVVEPAAQAQNIPRSLIGQVAFGATPQEAAALFAALTIGAADVRGATTSTAAIGFAEQLRTFFEPRPELATMGARIGELQARPELAQEFLAGASFEKTVLGPIQQLLTDSTSKVAKLFTANLEAIPDKIGLEKIAEETISSFGLDPLERAARLKRAFAAGEERLLLENLIGAEGGITREGLQGVLRASGMSAWGAKLETLGFEARTGVGRTAALETAEAILGRRLGELEAPRRAVIGKGGGGYYEARPPTPEEQASAQTLRAILEELRGLRTDAAGERRGRNTAHHKDVSAGP